MRFESIAKTNTTHTQAYASKKYNWFESIAKTNTTHTDGVESMSDAMFESIAKTNTTHTRFITIFQVPSLRVLLKQIQHTLHFYKSSKP